MDNNLKHRVQAPPVEIVSHKPIYFQYGKSNKYLERKIKKKKKDEHQTKKHTHIGRQPRNRERRKSG